MSGGRGLWGGEKSDEVASAGNVVLNMDAEAVRQLRMDLGWVFLIRGDAGSYCIIGWIVSYRRMDRIVSSDGSYHIGWIGSYRIGWIVSGNTGFYALDGYWLDGADGTDGADGALVGRWWDGPTLAGAGTIAPPLLPEREREHWLLRA